MLKFMNLISATGDVPAGVGIFCPYHRPALLAQRSTKRALLFIEVA